MQHIVYNLDIHAAHSCNLACESCSHFSNQGHKGVLSVEEAERWMKPWHLRLRPKLVSIVGGEPTLNPQLSEVFETARRHWPFSMIRIITNGFFLHKHHALPRILQRDHNGWLFLSIHHDSEFYLEKIASIADLLEDWVGRYRIRVVLFRSFEDWTIRYRGFGDSMLPFEDGDPRSSWLKCPAKYCRQLFDARLWKCPPVAYLNLQAQKYNLSVKWKDYVNYESLEPSCSDTALASFLQREEEPCCRMCPANPEHIRLPVPLRNATGSHLDAQAGSGVDHPTLFRLEKLSTPDPRLQNVK